MNQKPQRQIQRRGQSRYVYALFFMLQTPRTLTKKTLGDRAFLAVAPKLWNGLPSQIRNEPLFIDLKVYLRPIFLD